MRFDKKGVWDMKNKRIILFSLAAAILVALTIWIAWGNKALQLNTYTICSSRLPESFNGFRIAHVSDLHNTEIGKENEKLLAMLRKAEPDLIAITGDLIDSRNTDTEIALQFVQEAMKIAPCYYVTGNHEVRVAAYSQLKEQMKAAGVIILDDAKAEIHLNGDTISLLGVNDPSFQTDDMSANSEMIINNKLSCLKTDNAFSILLSHRPELFEIYAENEIDLVLSGHAHGGQFRLPFLGGVVAPNQGLFPKYDGGVYKSEDTNMIVSRGIGNSLFPFRFNNRPEVILIELESCATAKDNDPAQRK